MATTKGQVHDVFAYRVEDLADGAERNALAFRGQAQRGWDRPGGEWSGDPLDLAGLVAPYDRSDVDQNYAELIADGDDPGTAGDVVSVKTQGDYVALQERGLRARYASAIRCVGHMAARKRGHGDPKGIFRGGIVRYAQDCIIAGAGG
jgi:hypothetical protein